MGLNDLLGFGNASEKLLDVVSKGMGHVYEPIKIVAMAKARAKEIQILDKTFSKTENLITYSSDIVAINKKEKTLEERAQERVLFQEIKKQKNIEDIVINAYQNLDGKSCMKEKDISDEWITRFFELAGNITADDLKIIWGRILSEEILEPGNCSIRTLEILKNLTKKEAETFGKVANYIIESGDKAFILVNSEILKSNGITYKEILELDDALLMNCYGDVTFSLGFEENGETEIIKYGNYEITCRKIDNVINDDYYCMNVHLITNAGNEIFHIISSDSNEEYLEELLSNLRIPGVDVTYVKKKTR